MNILSIGNSFSQDAQRYLYEISKSEKADIYSFNLYIGGCPLSLHYRNMLSDNKAYTLEMNGKSTGFKVSLKEALLNREWDVITVQQVSSLSGDYDSYQPYLDKLCEYVRLCSPKAKLVFHQTWAYEQGSQRLTEELGYENYTDMFNDIKYSADKAAKAINADFIIPSGELFVKLLSAGIEKVHRDTYHASLGLGRFALGLLWYKILSGNKVSEVEFSDFDEEISSDDIKTVKKVVETF